MDGKRKLGWRDLTDRRVALMLAFGFSSGLPLLLVLGTLSARLASSGIDIKAIGLFSYLALPYTLKFIWSPVVDAFDVPLLSRLLGRRRAWMLVAQLCVAASLAVMASADPTTGLAPLAAAAFFLAFSSATQDVVVDGWRIDAVETERQGMMAAAYQLGYRIALVAAGAGALLLADQQGWRVAYLTMAALMGVGMAASLLAPVVDRGAAAQTSAPTGPAKRWSFKDAIVAPLADLYGREGIRLVGILLLVAFYRLPDFVSGVMANPLYIKLGFSLSQIAAISKLYGVWIGILGAFAGGFAIARLGLFPTLLIGAVCASASHLSMAWLAIQGPMIEWLVVAISIENFCGSFAGTALIAYMSGLTGAGFAATQYALLSSLYALPGKLVGGMSGFLVAAYGFPTFFAMTSAIGIPVVILCMLVGRPKAEAAQQPAPVPDAQEPAAAPPMVPARAGA